MLLVLLVLQVLVLVLLQPASYSCAEEKERKRRASSDRESFRLNSTDHEDTTLLYQSSTRGPSGSHDVAENIGESFYHSSVYSCSGLI